MKNKKLIGIIEVLGISFCIIITFIIGKSILKPAPETPEPIPDIPSKPEWITPTAYNEPTFNLNLIKTINSTQKTNYLISPYSMEMALQMLREGSAGTSQEEIEKVISQRKIPTLNANRKIEVANATFVKDVYSDVIELNYIQKLRDNYNAEVITDPFTTPDPINKWVDQKTRGMIPKILDNISEDFVLGIANAVAIDVEWEKPFECIYTTSESFEKENGKTMQTEMMHNTYESNAAYFETNSAEGVILPYHKYNQNGTKIWSEEEKGTQLEFVGILPVTNVSDYIESLTEEELKQIDQNKTIIDEKTNLVLSLPRFKYDFEVEKLKEVLSTMGIQKVFDRHEADLTNIMTRKMMGKFNIENLYVETAIHKTHIDLNENGTKAAAITYFGVEKATAMPREEPEYITVEFNRPFAYMIRDKETKEILFFGVVEEPNHWSESTCTKVDS